MKNSNIKILIIFCLIFLTIISSCKKQDAFLNVKPSLSLSTIKNTTDMEDLLNNKGLFNMNSLPTWGLVMGDEYYVEPDQYANLNPFEQNIYTFQKDIFNVGDVDDNWNTPYQQVYISNTVLDALPKIFGSQSELDKIKGMALFYRSFAFYDLVQTYAMPYDSTNAKSMLGIPLRLTSDLNGKSQRATIDQTYTQIIADLTTAIALLPQTSPSTTLPNRCAAEALLARVYIAMEKYSSAFKYADAALSLNGQITNYNDLTTETYYFADPTLFPLKENIYTSNMQNYDPTSFVNAAVDSNLYALYDVNDLRKTFFFTFYNGYPTFKGSYDFSFFAHTFNGLATDELYFIRAESSARLGNTAAAMNDLNSLLKNRYVTGTFVNRTANSSNDAIDQILLERRKELYFRGLRWEDLRRLNHDPNRAVTVTHIVNGVKYTLPPNDPRYAMAIPPDEIKASGIPQNQR